MAGPAQCEFTWTQAVGPVQTGKPHVGSLVHTCLLDAFFTCLHRNRLSGEIDESWSEMDEEERAHSFAPNELPAHLVAANSWQNRLNRANLRFNTCSYLLCYQVP